MKTIISAILLTFGLTAAAVEVPIGPLTYTTTVSSVSGFYTPSADEDDSVMVNARVNIPSQQLAGHPDVDVSRKVLVRIAVRVYKQEVADLLGFELTTENYKAQSLSALETAIISIAVTKATAALTPAPAE